MATVTNARDVILQAALPNGRVAGVTMQPNIVVDPSQVTGLGLIIDGTRLIDFESSAQVFQVNTAGAATPSSITLTINFRNVTGTPSLTVISGTLTSTPTLSGGPSVYTATLPYANMSTDTVTLRASVVYNSVTYTDDLTIVKARDGQFAVNAFLTNESHTVPSSDTGVVSSYTGAGGTFKVYQGSNDVTTSATYAVQSNPNSLTTSINSTTGVFSVTAGFGTGIDTATVTYRATYGGQTYDKVFTITKSKAGTAGSAGSRGSRTFYVSGQSSWSDAVATSAASVSGGPIVNDVVTEYNTTNFSQTRFWNGTSWIVVNAVVDGNLLVSGTVGAAAIAAGAIRASHLLVTGGQGQALNGDPTCSDPAAWFRPGGAGNAITFTTVTDGVASNRVIRSTGAHYFSSQVFPVQGGKKYRVSGYYRRTTAGSGTSLTYIRILAYNAAGSQAGEYRVQNPVSGAFPYEGTTPSTSSTWVKFSGQWTADPTVIWGYLDIHGLWDTNTGGVMEYQDLRVDEMVDSSLVVVGGIDADRIDTRNLTIKDSSGNIIFSAAQNLDLARIANNYRIQNNFIDSTWWSPNATLATAAAAQGWTLNGDTGENTFAMFTGPRGNSQCLWRMVSDATFFGSADGGFHAPINNIDRTKTYRFAIPVYRVTNSTAGGSHFFGISDVCDLNTTTPNGNPYFKSEIIPAGSWFLMVGYVFPSGSSTASNAGAGVYDLTTGQLYSSGVNYTWQTAATSCTVRAHQYYTGAAGTTSYFAPPIVHMIDGSEPSLNEFFNVQTLTAAQDTLFNLPADYIGNASAMRKFQGTNAWDASAVTQQGYSYGAFIEAKHNGDHWFIGLDTSSTSLATGYSALDYGLHISAGNYYIYEGGSNVVGATAITAGAIVNVTYDGSFVRYHVNGAIVRTIAAPANQRYFGHVCFHYPNAHVEGIRFGPYGLPSAVAPNNPINSGNVSTYIANAAIQNAQIGNYIASSNFNGTIDGSGNITADGTAGWAISKSGYAVFSNVKVRGDVQANTVIQGSVTTNTSASSSYAFYQLPNTAVTNFTQNVSGGSITCAGGYMFCVMSVGIEAHVTNTAITSIRLNIQPKINGTNHGIEFQAWMPVTAYTDVNGNTRHVGAQIPVIFNAGTKTGAQAVTFDCKATYYAGSSTANAGGTNGTSSYLFIGWQGFLLETRG